MSVSKVSELALRAAMNRLIKGEPERTKGRLTVSELAREAGVSRETANRAHSVLVEFRKIADVKKGKSTNPDNHVRALEKALAEEKERRIKETAALKQQLETYATEIRRLTLENDKLQRAKGSSGNILSL